MATAGIIAGVVRGLVALLRTPLFGGLWYRLKWWWARPAILLAMTTGGFLLDAVALGSPWYLALGSAITGLGIAVTSHEWQAVFRRAVAVRKAKENGEAEAPPDLDETPSGHLSGPDTM